MPINMTYDKASKILNITLTGTVELQEMIDTMHQFMSSDIPSDTNAIWDVSDMEFNNITYELQQNLIDARKRFDEKRGNAKIAIICDYTLAEPLLKMYTILSKDLSQVTRVFMRRKEALDWLAASD